LNGGTRGDARGLALRSPPMRRRAHRSQRAKALNALRSISFPAIVAIVAIALGLGGNAAKALNAEDQEEAHAEETQPSYAGTELPVDTHDPTQAAHPLRIVAYGLHPVGVALDWIIVRPAVWVVRHEPFRTIFGYQD
jgi:hypothetical protein